MEIRKLNLKTLTKDQFAQIVEIERNCGLEPYTPDMLTECIAFMDTFACLHDGNVVGFITMNAHGGYFGGSLYVINLNVAKAMAELRDLDIDCAILQSRSPTCGVNQVYDGTFSGKLIPGSGVFAQSLKDGGYRVMDAEDIFL